MTKDYPFMVKEFNFHNTSSGFPPTMQLLRFWGKHRVSEPLVKQLVTRPYISSLGKATVCRYDATEHLGHLQSRGLSIIILIYSEIPVLVAHGD